MKTIFISTALLMLTCYSFAQSNNPYNQRGLDYVASIKLITNDYYAGKVKEFNKETIDYYAAKIPLQTQTKPTMEMVSSIAKGLKAPGFNLPQSIESSSLSEFSKETISETWNIQNSPDALKGLVAEVDKINESNISGSEKENLLSLVAISYNVCNERIKDSGFAGRYPSLGGLTAGAFFGFIIGGVFGPGGAFIGMVAGGLLGGLS